MEKNDQAFGPITSSQMISDEQPPQHNYRMIFITVLVFLLALGGYIVLRNDTFKGTMQEALNLGNEKETAGSTEYTIENLQNPETTDNNLQLFSSTIEERAEPWVEVNTTASSATVGQEMTVTVSAFSGGKDITGYDLLLGVDPGVFEVVSISSAVPEFQIFQFDKGMYHAITGIKDIQAQDPTVFDKTSLVSVVLKPKQKGEGVITLLSSKGQERTQLVDKNVQVISPQVGSITVTIK